MGDGYTPSDVFDSVQFRGVQRRPMTTCIPTGSAVLHRLSAERPTVTPG
ncbi:hypothetical protein [Citrobacter koseri]